jgi:hypothetical protein
MARMTITMPDILKKQMDEVAEKVNWSNVAARAFEKKLGEIAARQIEMDTRSIIQRLRKTKMENEDADQADRNDGYQCGKKWAERRAEYGELEKLHRVRNDELGEPIGYSLYQIIFTEDEISYDEFLAYVLGGYDHSKFESDSFVDGFQAGALAVFDLVADEI